MKKLYTCKHQKEATNLCSICSEERIGYLCGSCHWQGKKKELSSKGNCPKCNRMVGRTSAGSEKRSSCDKCGKKVKSGELSSPYDNEHNEKWVEAHDCQPNSEKVKEATEETAKELPKMKEVKKNAKYQASCCNETWTYWGTKTAAEEAFKEFIKLTKNPPLTAHIQEERERERERADPGEDPQDKDKCLFCDKSLRQSIDENHYYSEGVKIKREGEEEKTFCSFECLDKHDNQQKQAKSNQQNNHSEKNETKNSNQQDNSNDKKWIIFPILAVAIIIFGSLIYIWLKRKK